MYVAVWLNLLEFESSLAHVTNDHRHSPVITQELSNDVPRTHNKFDDRSFSAAGPRLWNDLPRGLYGGQDCPSTPSENL